VDAVMVPRFRAGDLSGGLREGVRGLADAFRTPASVASSDAPAQRVEPLTQPVVRTDNPTYDRYNNELELSAGALMAILLGGVLLAGVGMWIYLRTVKQRCTQCGGEMARLPEDADDVHLDSGRRLEEVLGSVNHHVWHCAGCGSHSVVREPLLSRRDRCAECGYRTVGTTRTVVQEPTYDAAGSEQVERKCAHCGWADVDVLHLPRRKRGEPLRAGDLRALAHLAGDLADRAGRDRDSISDGWSGSGSGGGGSDDDDSKGGHSSGRGSSGRW
jgi:uncharacterized membrane protein YgcG